MSRFAALAAQLHSLAAEIEGHASPTAIAHSVAAGFHKIAEHLHLAHEHAEQLLDGLSEGDRAALHGAIALGASAVPGGLALAAPPAPAPAADQVQLDDLPRRMYEAYATDLFVSKQYAATAWDALDPAWRDAWGKTAAVALHTAAIRSIPEGAAS